MGVPVTIARVVVVAGLVGLLGGLAGCGGAKPTSAPTPEPNPKPGLAPQPAPVADPHEFDPAKHVVPATAATGRLRGKTFRPDRVELEGNRLVFRQGKDFFADLSVEITLDQKANPAAGMKLIVRPAQQWTDGVPMLLVSASSDKGLPDTKFVNEGYALTLELAKVDKGKSNGKVYLVLPDAEKSYLAGTFTVARKRSMSEPPGAEEVPFIRGTVTPPLKKGQSVSVGYVGLPAGGGNPVSDLAGGQVFGDDGNGGGVRSMTFAPRAATVRFEKFTPLFDFTNLPPGRYLVFARVKDGPVAWAWAEVAAGGRATADLKLDAAKTGTVEVKGATGQAGVHLVPADLTPSLGEAFIDQLVFSLGLEGEVKDGKATIQNVPAGKYLVRAGQLRAEVEVMPGKTTTVELKLAKK
jgi:hypothetical protein